MLLAAAYSTPVPSAEGTGLAFAILFGFAAILSVIFSIIYGLPLVIATWVLFKKADQPGWAAIIPFYSTWVQVKIARAPIWLFWVILVCGLIPGANVVALGCSIYLIVLFTRQYDRPDGFWWWLYLLPIVGVFKVKDANYKTGGDIPPASPAV